jgi:hypothetical protein
VLRFPAADETRHLLNVRLRVYEWPSGVLSSEGGETVTRRHGSNYVVRSVSGRDPHRHHRTTGIVFRRPGLYRFVCHVGEVVSDEAHAEAVAAVNAATTAAAAAAAAAAGSAVPALWRPSCLSFSSAW